MKDFNLELPINSLSFGQVSFGILHEIFERREIPNIFPIGNVDLKAYDVSQEFVNWLKFCIEKAKENYSRKDTTIKLWHLFDAEKRISDKQVLYTFHETDQLTPTEINIAKNNDVVLFSSNYALKTAQRFGVKNADVCYPYFDSQHVSIIDTPKRDSIDFLLIGKFEKRKHTAQILKIWSKMFANNPRYRLNCLINNHFIEPERWNEIVLSVFNGKVPWNINLLPRLEKNSQVNFVMNSCDIDLSGLSGAEGFNLPCFNMLALNKIGVVLEAHSHLDYMYEGNSIKVQPSGTEPIYDGMFFLQGAKANQGSMYTFNDNEVEENIKKSLNYFNEGKKMTSDLKDKFSVSNTVDTLLSHI